MLQNLATQYNLSKQAMLEPVDLFYSALNQSRFWTGAAFRPAETCSLLLLVTHHGMSCRKEGCLQD